MNNKHDRIHKGRDTSHFPLHAPRGSLYSPRSVHSSLEIDMPFFNMANYVQQLYPFFFVRVRELMLVMTPCVKSSRDP